MESLVLTGWHADPFGRHEFRFYDGARWTPYVKDGEDHAVDEPIGGTAPVSAAGPVAGRRSLVHEPVLVVRQRAKLVELVDEYDVLDAAGHPIGGVREVGQGNGRKALRALTSLDTALTHRLEVLDTDGSLLLGVTRRAPNGRRSRDGIVVVTDPMSREVGRFVQQWRLGKTRFGMVDGDGRPLGYLGADDWLGWNFAVRDLAGREVVTIGKSWRGLATELFTTADSYVVRLEQPLAEPLRSLAVAAALAIDTVRKQHDPSGAYTGGAALGLGGGLLGSLLD